VTLECVEQAPALQEEESSVIQWPHTPVHKLGEPGAFIVTAGTYLKAHRFSNPRLLVTRHHSLLP
jgi:hypothetical protein